MPAGNSAASGSGLGPVSLSGTAASGKTIVASGAGAAAWAYPPGYEWSYTAITAQVNVTGTTIGGATTIISPAAFTPDGSPVYVEFFSPLVFTPSAVSANNTLVVSLIESATQVEELGEIFKASGNPALAFWQPWYSKVKFTPSAAAHTYTVVAYVNSTTGSPGIGAGIGGASDHAPAFVRFTKV